MGAEEVVMTERIIAFFHSTYPLLANPMVEKRAVIPLSKRERG